MNVKGLIMVSCSLEMKVKGQTSFTNSVTKMAAVKPMKEATKLGSA